MNAMCAATVSRFIEKRCGRPAQTTVSTMCGATVSRFPEKRRGRLHGIDEQCSDTSIMHSEETVARAVQTTMNNMCADSERRALYFEVID